MTEIYAITGSRVTETGGGAARLGSRFGRLDLTSQLVLLAVEALASHLHTWPGDRVGLCLGARTGSLAADQEFWERRDAPGGPSPTLFTYTLPSAALGELAIRHRLTGPNLCLVGAANVLAEAVDWLQRGEVDACVCVDCRVITPAVGKMIQRPPAACASALLLHRGGAGGRVLRENDRDIEEMVVAFSKQNSAG